MSARKLPSARAARRAVDLLAQLGPDVLAAVVEAAIDRLDAVTPDTDFEDSDWDVCDAEDRPIDGAGVIGCEDDAEENGDAEPSSGHSLGGPDDPWFPHRWFSRPAVVTRGGVKITHLGELRL